MNTSNTMPAVFIGHGSPMNTLENNRYTTSWHDFGRSIPRPEAIVAISAHWYINATAVTAMASPRTIHDFYGFPRELFDFEYPVAGSPGLADRIVELLSPTWVGRDLDSWGVDHGTWSVLAHMFPGADVPVVQLSIDATKSFDEHVRIGAALAPLRDQGVLVVASGNVVHNLGRLDWSRPDAGEDWAVEFDQAVRDIMTTRADGIVDVDKHPRFGLAVPTPDHFIPLLYLAGLSSAAGTPTEVLIGGHSMGSLSMTSYLLP